MFKYLTLQQAIFHECFEIMELAIKLFINYYNTSKKFKQENRNIFTDTTSLESNIKDLIYKFIHLITSEKTEDKMLTIFSYAFRSG